LFGYATLSLSVNRLLCGTTVTK